MKKRNLILLLVIALILTGCGNKYKGYWCNYNETATIIVLLKDMDFLLDEYRILVK